MVDQIILPELNLALYGKLSWGVALAGALVARSAFPRRILSNCILVRFEEVISMKRKRYFGVILSFLILSGLACSLLSGVTDQGQDLLTTAQSLATDIDGGEILSTVEALATEVVPGDMLATVQAAATGFDPEDMLATADALGTQAASQGGDQLATAQALATQAGGEAPDDIPLVDGEKSDLFTSPFVVSYATSLDLASVTEFYQVEMPANGWDFDEETSVISDFASVLMYRKTDRTATVTITPIPGMAQTIVQILLQ